MGLVNIDHVHLKVITMMVHNAGRQFRSKSARAQTLVMVRIGRTVNAPDIQDVRTVDAGKCVFCSSPDGDSAHAARHARRMAVLS